MPSFHQIAVIVSSAERPASAANIGREKSGSGTPEPPEALAPPKREGTKMPDSLPLRLLLIKRYAYLLH
jgi:hypothetical protein